MPLGSLFVANNKDRYLELEKIDLSENIKQEIINKAFDIASENFFLDVLKVLYPKASICDLNKVLTKASELGFLDVIKHFYPMATTPLQRTVVFTAAEKGHAEIIQFLFEKMNKVEKELVFLEGAQNGHVEVMKLLSDDAQISNDCKGLGLLDGVECKQIESVKFVLTLPGIPLGDIQSAFNNALKFNHREILRTMIAMTRENKEEQEPISQASFQNPKPF